MNKQSKHFTPIYLYTRYERLWHWLQAVIIILLLVTGFEVHGQVCLLGFNKAVKIHNIVGLTWIITFVFFVFWVVTAGEWKHYIPTSKKIFKVIQYYSYGIFVGASHPVPKSKRDKHNPLQRLAYLSLAMLLLPWQMATGLIYWKYDYWKHIELKFAFLDLNVVAICHVLGAFCLLIFFVIHIYMTTTGHNIFSHIKAMITGWEEIENESKIEDWELADKNK